jgi:hypothetical protein
MKRMLLIAGILLAADIQMAPDGTYVNGRPQLAPDGTYVGGRPHITPDGSYVGVPDKDDDENPRNRLPKLRQDDDR